VAAWIILSVSLAASPAPTFFGDEIDRQVDLVVQRRSACGPTAAWYCLQRLGYEVSLEEAIRSAGLTEKGISLESLFGLIRSLAPSTEPKALAGRPEDVEDLPKPCILILENHCVALDGFDAETGRARLFDPVKRELVYEPIDQVKKLWKGEAIVFERPQMSRSAFVALVVLAGLVVSSPGIWLVFFRSPAR